MVSTMGNGYTFSLQTALFACAVLAVYRFRNVKPVYPRNEEYGNFAVFGDDIIVETQVDRDVRELLELLGFSVNHSKSFACGPFRESCGVDFHSGVNIRGVYVKTLRSVQDCISLINELNLFSARTCISLPRGVRFLMRLITRWGGRVLYVPMDAPSFAGVRVPLLFFSPKLDRNGSYKYMLYEPVPIGYRFNRVSDEVTEIKFKGFSPRNLFAPNPFGFELSFLAGAIKDDFVAVRHDRPKYRLRSKITPCWDNLLSHSQEWFNWRRFGTAVHLNLFK